jgi:hypothetical protein
MLFTLHSTKNRSNTEPPVQNNTKQKTHTCTLQQGRVKLTTSLCSSGIDNHCSGLKSLAVYLHFIAPSSGAEKLSQELYSFSPKAKVESTAYSSVDVRSLSHRYELLSQPFVIEASPLSFKPATVRAKF